MNVYFKTILAQLLLCFLADCSLLAQSPGNVSGSLETWYKTNTGTSSSSNGVNLTFWNDATSNNHDLNSVTSDPQFQTNRINFNPVVDFDGNDAFTDDDGENYINGISAITVFSVTQSDGNNEDRAWFDTENSDGSDDVFSLRYDNSGINGG